MTKRKNLNLINRLNIAFKQEYKCFICQNLLKPRLFQIDHKIPLCLGGSNDSENLQALCLNCHAEKTFDDVSKYHTTKVKVNKYWASVFRGPFKITSKSKV
jgi:5-methylcytosine-specific restriction endonuclease McrA